jgi:hypothetical protein
MNIPTIVIGFIIAALLFFAIRYLVKNGMCAACEDKSACEAAKKAGLPGPASSCGGKCSSCQYYEQELKAAAAKHSANI